MLQGAAIHQISFLPDDLSLRKPFLPQGWLIWIGFWDRARLITNPPHYKTYSLFGQSAIEGGGGYLGNYDVTHWQTVSQQLNFDRAKNSKENHWTMILIPPSRCILFLNTPNPPPPPPPPPRKQLLCLKKLRERMKKKFHMAINTEGFRHLNYIILQWPLHKEVETRYACGEIWEKNTSRIWPKILRHHPSERVTFFWKG